MYSNVILDELFKTFRPWILSLLNMYLHNNFNIINRITYNNKIIPILLMGALVNINFHNMTFP